MALEKPAKQAVPKESRVASAQTIAQAHGDGGAAIWNARDRSVGNVNMFGQFCGGVISNELS